MFMFVTGHRPDKLGGWESFNFDRLTQFAEKHIRELTDKHSVDSWFIGMALGWDMACAQACANLGIPYFATIPMIDQPKMWRSADTEKWTELCRRSRRVIIVSDPGYDSTKMMIRNRYMVNRSQMGLSLWDGSKGGTGNCVAHAKSLGKEVINVWGDYVKIGRYD